jgi:uncharacterized coiled-coil DUF342 family protein
VSRPAAEIRGELDGLNAERVKLDSFITECKQKLNEMNARSSELEKEFQAADALEAQAKRSGG